jgi:Pyruvate/2-oxoacid:ferredoxin oxidoreductase delta subunit
MSLRDQPTLRVVLYEGRDADSLVPSQRFATLSALLDRGYSVTRVASEGRVSAHARGGAILLLGQFNGTAMPEVDEAADGTRVRSKDIRGFEPQAVADLVETVSREEKTALHGEWKPLFPVIDYDRCTNCMQCLSFCLFGVYGVDPGQKIQVQNNENCKTNCPACSRVCPEAAIMFPKYKAGPINGDVVSDSDLNREKMKIDISSLLGGDVYSMLRERSEKAKSRFSKERDANKALTERQKCLIKLAQSGDIPAEVLMSLPSPDEIARRAEEAKAKATAALESLAKSGSTGNPGPTQTP